MNESAFKQRARQKGLALTKVGGITAVIIGNEARRISQTVFDQMGALPDFNIAPEVSAVPMGTVDLTGLTPEQREQKVLEMMA